MEGFGHLGFGDMSSSIRKKRSSTSRRPWNDSQPNSGFHELSSLSSTPTSENVCKSSSEDSLVWAKKASVKLCSARASFSNIAEAESLQNTFKVEDGGFLDSDEASNNESFRGSNEGRHIGVDTERHTGGVLAPTKGLSSLENVGFVSDVRNENRVKKVKLKVCGVTRTINAKSVSDGASGVGSYSSKSSRFPDASRPQHSVFQDNSGDNCSFTSDKGSGRPGVLLKVFSRSGFPAREADSLLDKMPDENISMKQTDKYESLRKRGRVPKRCLLEGQLYDGSDDDDDDDDEIRFLEKVKTAKITAARGVDNEDDEKEGSRRHRRVSKVLKRKIGSLYDVDASSRLSKEGKKHRAGRVSEDADYMEEEDLVSDDELENKGKKVRKETVDLLGDAKKEMTVTTRQRALQTGRDVSSRLNTTVIEFPQGLPPAAPKKQKDKLSEVEQQLKKAEAAQRRRMQVEKAARESEAEAIRKILGQDSTRKRREEKMRKQQEELAQEKAANAAILASDTVRWVVGPSGTVVTFPKEIGLPNIFNARPCSYPPPREKCAGPSCTNPYKYRDSKSKLPLCSLQCYKALHKKMPPVSAC